MKEEEETEKEKILSGCQKTSQAGGEALQLFVVKAGGVNNVTDDAWSSHQIRALHLLLLHVA